MGIADRDYARAPIDGEGPRADGRGWARRRGSPHRRLAPLSVNTWIIIINIAVFVLNNIAFRTVQWPVAAGAMYNRGVSADQMARGKFNPDARLVPFANGTDFGRPIYDPQTVVRVLTGQEIPVQIGVQRFKVMPVVDAFGHFSTGKFWSDGQLWRLISFQFLHANMYHIGLNMLGLFFFGAIVEEYLGRKRYLAFYLTCGVFGALAYLMLNLLGYMVGGWGVQHLPFLLFDDVYTPLIGASAGVFGVLLAAAYIAPDELVDVLLVVSLRLRTAAYIFLAIAVFNLFRGGANAGGDAAHVGGAIAGALLIRRTYILRDIVSGFGWFGGRRQSKPQARVRLRPGE